jgi:hypothetical protein
LVEFLRDASHQVEERDRELKVIEAKPLATDARHAAIGVIPKRASH